MNPLGGAGGYEISEATVLELYEDDVKYVVLGVFGTAAAAVVAEAPKEKGVLLSEEAGSPAARPPSNLAACNPGLSSSYGLL